MPRRILALFFALGLPVAAHASGFALQEQSASALGRGAAVSASSGEPAAAWYNPAVLAYEPGLGGALSGLLYAPGTSFSPAAGGPATVSLRSLDLVPALYAHTALGERVRLGLAANVPFALAIAWPEDWVGARHAVATRLWALSLNLSVAVRLGERVALAAGLAAVRGDVEITTGLLPEMGAGRVNLAGSAWAPGANLALLYRPWPGRLQLGVTYRSRVRLALDGRARFTPEKPAWGAVNQGARATITLPDVIVAAAEVRPRPELALSAEIGRTLWSSFDRLQVEFDEPSMHTAAVERGRHDPWSVRAGAEWHLPRVALALRAGLGFEQSTATAATLAPSGPDAQRLALCLGLGYRLGALGVDLGYMLGHYLDASAVPPPVRPDGYDPGQSPAGTYRSRAHLLALTLSYQPGAVPRPDP